MRLALLATILLAGNAWSQDVPAVDVLIEQLGNANYRIREAAMNALLLRPDAEGALRVASRSQDAEIASRAARLVDALESRRFGLGELDRAIGAGDIERAVDLIVAAPEDKIATHFWPRIEKVYFAIANKRNGGRLPQKIFLPRSREQLKAYSEATAPLDTLGRCFDLHGVRLLRVGQADFNQSRLKRDSRGQFSNLIFSAGTTSVNTRFIEHSVVFATGDVSVRSDFMHCSLLFSGGEVKLETNKLIGCVIIAKGSINILNSSGIDNQIISGKKVLRNGSSFPDELRDFPVGRSQFAENDANPLGYIRWREEAKSAPEKK